MTAEYQWQKTSAVIAVKEATVLSPVFIGRIEVLRCTLERGDVRAALASWQSISPVLKTVKVDALANIDHVLSAVPIDAIRHGRSGFIAQRNRIQALPQRTS